MKMKIESSHLQPLISIQKSELSVFVFFSPKVVELIKTIDFVLLITMSVRVNDTVHLKIAFLKLV